MFWVFFLRRSSKSSETFCSIFCMELGQEMGKYIYFDRKYFHGQLISSFLLPNCTKYKSRLLTDKSITSVLQIILKISVGQAGRAYEYLCSYTYFWNHWSFFLSVRSSLVNYCFYLTTFKTWWELSTVSYSLSLTRVMPEVVLPGLYSSYMFAFLKKMLPVCGKKNTLRCQQLEKPKSLHIKEVICYNR